MPILRVNLHDGWPMTPNSEWLAWLPAGICLCAALVAAFARAHCWHVLAIATRLGLAVALLNLLSYMRGAIQAPQGFGLAAESIVAMLVAFLGWIIGRYAQQYLEGEPGQPRFAVAFLVTLGAVGTVIVSSHLAVLIAAWILSSAGLHHLLTFYRERAAAVIVAHKKFLASRFAEVFLVAAAVLLFRQWGTFDIAAIDMNAQTVARLPPFAAAAAFLIAAAVILKCAQLPLHGWLIQVMEAPTPVSALLHAGVVNLGGYVLIRLGPLVSASRAAQGLLVAVGALTAALAGLVMLTRITVKVRLAWSTCSQMGFMVMECGLGLYDLALLHLVAHALYKAHAFLAAGDAVRDSLERALVANSSGKGRKPSLAWALLALPAAAVIAAGSAIAWQCAWHLQPPPWIAVMCLACGLAPLLWPLSPHRSRPSASGMLAALLAAQFYFAWHWLLSEGGGFVLPPPRTALALFAGVVLVALYVAQSIVALRPTGSLAVGLYDWAYSGLYLDERFTRLTFRLWPARVPACNTGHHVDCELETRRSPA